MHPYNFYTKSPIKSRGIHGVDFVVVDYLPLAQVKNVIFLSQVKYNTYGENKRL